ncbi:MAG: hypothetical protein HYZ45_06505, partial [Burkholderiales bacterium]|nr:hypothetical protein [Burkholderiales bacterium]
AETFFDNAIDAYSEVRVALQSDGKILAAGSFCPAGCQEEADGVSSSRVYVARYSPNGQLDSTFGSGGYVKMDVNSSTSCVRGIAVQSDGRIVLVGAAKLIALPRHIGYVARFNQDGSLDAEFGGTGIVKKNIVAGADDVFTALTMQNDGKIVFAGTSLYSTYKHFVVGRMWQGAPH